MLAGTAVSRAGDPPGRSVARAAQPAALALQLPDDEPSGQRAGHVSLRGASASAAARLHRPLAARALARNPLAAAGGYVVAPGGREGGRRQHPRDRALGERWRGAGSDTAAVRPRPLQPGSRAGFLRHEAARPFFLVARWAQREGAPRLPFARAKGGL